MTDPYAGIKQISVEWGPRARVASDPNTPPETLAMLAYDFDYWVRTAVAGNPNLPHEVHAMLAHDRDPDVRAAYAANPSALPELLAELVWDADHWHVYPNGSVSFNAMGNPNTPEAERRRRFNTNDD
jgi:hypothetical protein